MSLKYRLIPFLAALIAYLLFAFQWVNTYIKSWYANIPEETEYLRVNQYTSPYVYYGWSWGCSFLLFLAAGITTLVVNKPRKWLLYGLMTVLFFSSYYTFLFSAGFPKWTRTGTLNFVILCLFGISLFRYYLLSEQKTQPV